MSDQRVGRHVRIYEWDEVEIEETPAEILEPRVAVTAEGTKKNVPVEEPKGLRNLLKRKIF